MYRQANERSKRSNKANERSNKANKANERTKMTAATAIIANAECSGVFGKNSYTSCSYILGRPETKVYRTDYVCDYHLFIRCGDKVYMDVKKVGDIIMSFDELQKNKYWKHYYDLSLMLTNDLHSVQNTKETGGFNDNWVYEYKRYWGIDTATIYGTQENTAVKEVANRENNCYYRINPFHVENMEYSTPQELDVFQRMYVCRYEINSGRFKKNSRYLYDLAFDYCVSLMEKEIEEMEDKDNIVKLRALNEKVWMNDDLLRIVYDNIVSGNGKDKYGDALDALKAVCVKT